MYCFFFHVSMFSTQSTCSSKKHTTTYVACISNQTHNITNRQKKSQTAKKPTATFIRKLHHNQSNWINHIALHCSTAAYHHHNRRISTSPQPPHLNITTTAASHHHNRRISTSAHFTTLTLTTLNFFVSFLI